MGSSETDQEAQGQSATLVAPGDPLWNAISPEGWPRGPAEPGHVFPGRFLAVGVQDDRPWWRLGPCLARSYCYNSEWLDPNAQCGIKEHG